MKTKASRSRSNSQIEMTDSPDSRSQFVRNDACTMGKEDSMTECTNVVQVGSSPVARCGLCMDEIGDLVRLPDRIDVEDPFLKFRILKNDNGRVETKVPLMSVKHSLNTTFVEVEYGEDSDSTTSHGSTPPQTKPSQPVVSDNIHALPTFPIRRFNRIQATRKAFRCFGLADVVKITVMFPKRRRYSVLSRNNNVAKQVSLKHEEAQNCVESNAHSSK